MKKILAYDKNLAEQKATELNMHLQKEALGYIDLMVQELKEFEATAQEGNYVPSCMGALPTYSFEAIGGTGLPSDKTSVTAPTTGTAPAAAQPVLKKATVKVKTVTAKANKTTKISVKKAFKVNSSKTSLKFKKVSGNKNITITKKGTIKVKKGLVKGKTYKLKVKVTAAEGKGYSKLSKTVTLKIKVN